MAYVTDYVTLTWVCDHCGTRNVARYRYSFRHYIHERCDGTSCPVRLGWNRTNDCHRQMYVPDLDEHERAARVAARKAVAAEHRERRAEQRAHDRLMRYLERKYGYPLEA